MKLNFFNIFFVLLLLLFGCKKNVTTLDSDDCSNQEDRIKKLKENVVCASEIYDAEFELFNVNGFANTRNMSVPGASSWNYKFVVKIDTSDIMKWLENFTETKNVSTNLQSIIEITKIRKEHWKAISSPRYYIRPNDNDVFVVLFEKEGILYKSVVNL